MSYVGSYEHCNTISIEIIGKGNDTEREKFYFTEGHQSGLPEIKYEY